MKETICKSLRCLNFDIHNRLSFFFQYAEDNSVPLVVLIGESEVQEGVVKLRETITREEVTVKREELIALIKQRLAKN